MSPLEKWSALLLAALPQIGAAGWLYYRTWMMELEWRAQWSQYLTGFMFFVLLLSIFLTLFIFPVPKKMRAKPLPLGEKNNVPPTQKTTQTQSPYRGYNSTPSCYTFPRVEQQRKLAASYYRGPTHKTFSLRDIWKAILRYLRQERIIP